MIDFEYEILAQTKLVDEIFVSICSLLIFLSYILIHYTISIMAVVGNFSTMKLGVL